MICRLPIKIAGRLVCQIQHRIVDKRALYRNALALARRGRAFGSGVPSNAMAS